MADEKPTVDGETPLAAAPATGDPPKGETPKDKAVDPELIKSLRDENARRRKENAALEARLKQLEDGQLSETERLAKQAQENLARAERAEAVSRREMALNAVRDVAVELGLNVRMVPRLLNDHEWEFSDTGRPIGVMATVKKLVEEFPELAGGTAETTNHGRTDTVPLTSSRRPRLTDPELWDPK